MTMSSPLLHANNFPTCFRPLGLATISPNGTTFQRTKCTACPSLLSPMVVCCFTDPETTLVMSSYDNLTSAPLAVDGQLAIVARGMQACERVSGRCAMGWTCGIVRSGDRNCRAPLGVTKATPKRTFLEYASFFTQPGPPTPLLPQATSARWQGRQSRSLTSETVGTKLTGTPVSSGCSNLTCCPNRATPEGTVPECPSCLHTPHHCLSHTLACPRRDHTSDA